MRRAVGIEKTVHTEIAVVHFFLVVAAVGIFVTVAVTFFVVHRVVTPFPNTAAHQLVAGIKYLPVILQPTGTDAHRVRIFTKVKRFALVFVAAGAVAVFDNIGNAGVHFRNHVISRARGADNALVMHRDFRADLFEICIAFVLVVVAAGFVAERPHRNRRVVAVTQIHPADAVDIPRLPLRVVAYQIRLIELVRSDRARAVRFNVRFIHNVKPEYIRQRQKHRVRGIVRRAHRVDVVLLHQRQIFLDVFRRHDISRDRVAVVVIDAFHFNRNPVEFKNFAFNRDRLKA